MVIQIIKVKHFLEISVINSARQTASNHRYNGNHSATRVTLSTKLQS